MCDVRLYRILGRAGRCGRVHLEKAGGGAGGRKELQEEGDLKTMRRQRSHYGRASQGGFAEAAWTENVFWERRK